MARSSCFALKKKKSFIELKFIYYTVHSFKVYSIFFCIFSDVEPSLQSNCKILFVPQKETHSCHFPKPLHLPLNLRQTPIIFPSLDLSVLYIVYKQNHVVCDVWASSI